MASYFDSGTGLLLKKVALSFVRAFVGSALILVPGVLAAPDFEASKALAIAALIAAVTAGVRAVQAFLALGESPAPATGTEVLSESER